MIRTNEDVPFRLGPDSDSDYTVPRNTTMSTFSSITARNQPTWASVRPQTVSRPLDEFWPERFLVRGREDSKFKFSVEGLAECWMPYGGGQRMCPGRHFAKNGIIGTLGVLLDLFDCELVDRRAADGVQSDQRWVPYGTLPPTRRVVVRLTRR